MSGQYRLLLVDDDDFIRSVIGESLLKLGYAVDFAQDGLEAWNRLAVDAAPCDLVLLDRNMPRMDGIALLKRLKADQRFAELPVVMLTGANQPEDVVEGLAVGAHYYLTKPVMQDVLSRVVENALREAAGKLEMRAQLGLQKNNLRLMQRAEFSFRTLQEARDLALLLADASADPRRTVSGYSELLVNAVEHGNLAISYEEKGMLLGEGWWSDEVEQRLQMEPYAQRVVTVEVQRRPDAFAVTIRDQGDGFDWHRYLELDPARAFDLHGRGIAMSRGMSFDTLEYMGNGNTVVATVRQ